MVKLWLPPALTPTPPDGDIEPPLPALALIVYVLEEPPVCVMENPAPAMVRLAVLVDDPVLLETVVLDGSWSCAARA